MKKLLVLGASGSIGTQTVDVVKLHPDELELVGAGVGKRIEYLKELLAAFPLKYAYSIEPCAELEAQYPNTRFFHGETGMEEIVAMEGFDTFVNALVGFAGLKPTIAAIHAGKDIALANKESLVVAGDIVMREVKKAGVRLYPIDSEHSAIYQCLIGNNFHDIKKLIITGSGGSFRDLTREQLKNVTVQDALKHPNWDMGAKITIDCATMMNKGFEVMEAHYLFDVDYEDIDIVLHKESIIHSMVEFKDGAILAQMSYPDMHIPIQFALLNPRHKVSPYDQKLDLGMIGSLNFKTMDYKRYPLPAVVKRLGKLSGNFGALINGANDKAVELFLAGKISFLDIERAIAEVLRHAEFKKDVTLSDVLESHKWAEDYVMNLFGK